MLEGVGNDETHPASCFFETPGNPIPRGAKGGFFTARDGMRIRYGLFPTHAASCLGTVVIFPGRLSFMEKYFEVIETFSASGFDVAMFDPRGQGASQRGLKHQQNHFVVSFDDYVSDLRMFMDCHVMARLRGPFFMFGHSIGGLVALLAEPALRPDLKGIVCVTPAVSPTTTSLSIQRIVMEFLCSIGLGSLRAGIGGERPTDFEDNNFTHNRDRFERTKMLGKRFPDLAVGAPTIGYFKSALQAIRDVNDSRFVRDFATPAQFILAGSDKILPTSEMIAYADKVPGAEIITVEGSKHDLPQENDIYRDQMFAAMTDFLARHSSATRRKDEPAPRGMPMALPIDEAGSNP